ncbi:hypothetical protein [Haliscomenobacter sp.]|uniref:hypothetical protein n=1 Tax=Haliscomenobacter sp. TaxID=2717303 RepID=UPI003BA95C73
MAETSPLAEADLALLKGRIKQDEQATAAQILAFFSFIILIIFLPGRGNDPSLYQTYGFLWPFVVSFSAMSVFFLYWKYKVQKQLNDDLKLGVKTIEPFLIIKKEKSFANKGYYIWLDSAEKSFEKITFLLEDAPKIDQATHLVIEYAPKSKTIFNKVLITEIEDEEGT